MSRQADPVAALTRAAATEAKKAQALRQAALAFAKGNVGERTGCELEMRLQAAAKAWTNAYHQRSRCEKHAREA